jgi:TP901 family phage tail tape measure protein
MEKKVKITVEAKDKTSTELGKSRTEIEKTTATVKKNSQILAAHKLLDTKPYKDIQREMQQLQAAYNRLARSGKLSTSELYNAKQKLKEKTAELKKETGDWVGVMGKAKAGIAGLAGAGYLFVKSFQQYSEFSQRMGEVNTLIDVSQERFASLGKEIRGLTKDIPQAASELAAAEYDIISAGVALEKSVGVLELSAKAAVAGVTDTKTAANAGIAVINAYGKSIDELGDVYDVLFQTVKIGVTTFPELSQNIGEVLPTAKAANVGIKEVGASIAALTKAGIRTPQAMTALKGAINALAAPAPEAKKQFDALGITWEGLIPTLDKIREKGMDIAQMRLLIPDVEARTGVLALTQNFDSLIDILGEMETAGGATQAAYEKMADTPENQMKLFKNTINDITMSAGQLVATGLLPIAKAVRLAIESLSDADPVTKGIVLTLGSAAAGFLIWKLGLGNMVTGLIGFVLQARAANVAMGTLTQQITSSGIAMKAALAGSIIYTVTQLVLLTKAIYEWRQAAKVAEEAQNNLFANTDRMIEKFKEFKDIKLPDDITKLAQEDLEKFSKDLAKARAYYTALKMKMEEKGDTAGLKEVNARLNEIQLDFKRVGESASSAATEMEKPAEAVKATEDQLKSFEEQAKKAYEEATKQAASYAEKVIAFEEKIKYARLSTEDKIRELGRKGLEEAVAWADKKREAEEKLYAAKQAMAKGDYELAEKLAKDAESLYADLATEVKGSEAGKDVVVKSIEETKEVAINGVKAVGTFIDELYTAQKDAAQTAKDEWTATADGIKAQLDEIAKQREANVVIQLKQLEAAQAAINALIKPEYKDIYVRVHQQQAKAQGGPITPSAQLYAAVGRRLPGYGGGDKIDVKAEGGEWIIRKEAVKWAEKKFGSGFFHAINTMRLDAADVLKRRIGGMISNISIPSISVPRYAYQTGGAVSGPGETFTIRLQAGNVEAVIPSYGDKTSMRGQVKALEKELIRLGMVTR